MTVHDCILKTVNSIWEMVFEDGSEAELTHNHPMKT